MTQHLPIGAMQGRLVPPEGDFIQRFPRRRWANEFAAAAAAGLACIEWVYDEYGLGANPIETDAGIAQMRALAASHGVAVRSLCADLFMERPLVRASADELASGLARLRWLLGQCAQAGISRVVLPFVDNAAIRTPPDADAAVSAIEQALETAGPLGIELHLETALDPEAFRALLARLPHPLVKANYDSGNSAALGYDPREEFAAYGERIGSVHIKDRLRGGGTVPLGQGAADLPAVAALLRSQAYAGDIILQVARGESGEEVAWARHNRAYAEQLWAKAG